MALILNFDTTTNICSVALSEQEKLLALRENDEGKNHASLLTRFISEVLKEADKKPEEINAVSVSKGPGSYTGLRIGVSTAKGIAYALSIPVIALPTLKIMASGYLEENNVINESDLLCPMIDARRMEVYTAMYTREVKEYRKVQADIIDENSYLQIRNDHRLIIFGDGARKCENIFSGEEVIIDNSYRISARHMIPLSFSEFEAENFEDVAYFEPFYLKDFVATIPKKKVF